MTEYVLLGLDILLVALLLTVAGYVLVGALRLLARGRGPARSRVPAAGSGRSSVTDADATWRRCENCKHRWEGVPGQEVRLVRLRRVVRRAARKRQRTVEWARPQGWSRCPSCLSTQVRDSRKQSAR